MGKSVTEQTGVAARAFLTPTYGHAIFQIAATVARLGVPDLIGDGSATAEEIADTVGADPEMLFRLLRAAAAAGIFSMTADRRFRLTSLGRIFTTASPWRAGVGAVLNSHPAIWQAWGGLEGAVRTGKPAFDTVHGKGIFEHLGSDAELAEAFHVTMASGTETQIEALVENFDFGQFQHIVDVGGGSGVLLSAILAAFPRVHGTVFDTEDGLQEAPQLLRKTGVAARARTVRGNFFESVPTGADAYLLKNVLIDWNDESCVRILRNCRTVLAPEGQVLVLASIMPETIAGEGAEPDADALMVSLFDVSLIVLTPGRERTLTEYESLFAAAGLALEGTTAIPCGARYSVIHAVPA